MQAFWQSYAVALIVVGLMLYGLHAVARVIARGRLRSQVDTRLIAVVTSTYVSQNTAVSLVKAGSRYLLIGGGNGHLQTLCELPADEVARWLADERFEGSGSGAPRLARALRRMRNLVQNLFARASGANRRATGRGATNGASNELP